MEFFFPSFLHFYNHIKHHCNQGALHKKLFGNCSRAITQHVMISQDLETVPFTAISYKNTSSGGLKMWTKAAVLKCNRLAKPLCTLSVIILKNFFLIFQNGKAGKVFLRSQLFVTLCQGVCPSLLILKIFNCTLKNCKTPLPRI